MAGRKPVSYDAVAPPPERTSVDQDGISSYQRAILLFVVALFTTGTHFGKHSISGLGPEIMSYLHVERLQFAFLFSLQQLPGIILPIAGGLGLTYVPLAAASVVLASSVFVSMIMCAVAINYKSYQMLLTGRFVFGLADGLLVTVQGAIIARWFKHHNVSTAFGVMLLMSRLSSFAGFATPPVILNKFGLSAAMWLAVLVAAIPVLASILYSYFAIRYSPRSVDVDTADHQHREGQQHNNIFVAFSHLRLPFWILAFTFLTVASSTYTFLHFATDVFGQSIGMNTALSALLSGLLMLCAGLTSPFIGAAEDRIGKRPLLLVLSSASITMGLLVCSFVVAYPSAGARTALFALFLIALGLSVAPVTLLSCVAMAVHAPAMPLALGAYKSVENIGMAVVHVLVGAVRDASASYLPALLLLAAIAVSALVPLFSLSRMLPELALPARAFRNRTSAETKATPSYQLLPTSETVVDVQE